jgi:hypothetical protein
MNRERQKSSPAHRTEIRFDFRRRTHAAIRKDGQIGQLMQLVKNTAVDCSVHSSGHNATGTKQDCYIPPSNKKDVMMINFYDREDPYAKPAKILPVPTNGKKIDLVFVEGDSSVYEAKAGVKVNVWSLPI